MTMRDESVEDGYTREKDQDKTRWKDACQRDYKVLDCERGNMNKEPCIENEDTWRETNNATTTTDRNSSGNDV